MTSIFGIANSLGNETLRRQSANRWPLRSRPLRRPQFHDGIRQPGRVRVYRNAWAMRRV